MSVICVYIYHFTRLKRLAKTNLTQNTRVAEVTPIKGIPKNTSDTSTSDENHQTISDVTPTKRKLSVVIEKLHLPFKKLHLNDKSSTSDQFKVPELPSLNTPVRLK